MSAMDCIKPKYRAEIDGLRALAVLSVIFFHAGFKLFSGGFVGVDVFFVISGYLITSIILTEKQEGIFSLPNFYERRARRILPPLFFVMLACLPFAWIKMLPDQLIDFSKSLEAVSIFISNIFFWKNTGYFSENIEEKPLVHTWSLGIEEQYYLLFPLLLILFWKIGNKKLLIFISVILLLSFVASEYSVLHHPSAAFFLIPNRAWELLVGSLLAFFSFKGIILHRYFSLKINQLISIIGLTFITLSILFFNEDTPFPGLYALMPVIGTAMIIGFSSPDTLVFKCLSNKKVVQIGLVSYSAYLWHQPLFSFARIYLVDKPSKYIFIFLSIITFILALLTWKYIEQPFRNKKNFSRQQIFLFSVIGALFFILIGVLGSYQKGFPERLSMNQRALFADSLNSDKLFNHELGCFLLTEQDKNQFKSCTFESKGNGSVLLWGDSHAAHLFPGLKSAGQYHKLIQLTASGCFPIIDMDFSKETPKRPYCQEINTYIIEKIKKTPPDKVILSARWGMRGDTWRQLEKTIKQLQKVGIKDILIIGPAPIWDDRLPHIMARFNAPFSQLPTRLKSHVSKDIFLLDHEMQIFSQQQNVKYVSLISILCNQDGCLTRLGNKADQLISFDDGHFTQSGSKYVVSKFVV